MQDEAPKRDARPPPKTSIGSRGSFIMRSTSHPGVSAYHCALLFALLASVTACADEDESYAAEPPLPMRVQVSDSPVSYEGRVHVRFYGKQPASAPDEHGVTPVVSGDTPENALIWVLMDLGLKNLGGDFQADERPLISLDMAPAYWRSLTQQHIVDVRRSPHLVEDGARAHQSLFYSLTPDPPRTQDELAAIRERQLTSMQLQNRSNQNVVLTLTLGDAISAPNRITVENAESEAQMHFTGPISLSCSVIQGGQVKFDPSWQSPFCARVKAEMNLSQYLD